MTLQNVKTKIVLMIAAIVLVVFVSGCANPLAGSDSSSGSDSEDHTESSLDGEAPEDDGTGETSDDGEASEESGASDGSDSSDGASEDGSDDENDNGSDDESSEDTIDDGADEGNESDSDEESETTEGDSGSGENEEADVEAIEQAFITGDEETEAAFEDVSSDEEDGIYESDGSATVVFDSAIVGSRGVMVSFTVELSGVQGGERDITLKTLDAEGDLLEDIVQATLGGSGDTKEVSFTLDGLEAGNRYELHFPGIGGNNKWIVTDLEVTQN